LSPSEVISCDFAKSEEQKEERVKGKGGEEEAVRAV
jgi:hypothetical protein